MICLEAVHLSKSYGRKKAVDDLSFSVEKGNLTALLGLNGAGKTTTLSMICRSLFPDSGTVKILGEDIYEHPEALFRHAGAVFQESVLDPVLTVEENLCCRGSLYGLSGPRLKDRLDWAAEHLDLKEIWKQRLSTLSGGQRRRADLARALLPDPELLILDEPAAGLDPWNRKRIWQVLSALQKDKSLSILLTTHSMEEAEKADQILILDEGKLRASGTVHDLKKQFASDRLILFGPCPEFMEKTGIPAEKTKERTVLFLENPGQGARLIARHPEAFADFELSRGSMEDVFLKVTGKSIQKENG